MERHDLHSRLQSALRGPHWRKRLIPPAVLCLIIAGFYWKLILTDQFDWDWSPDLAQQVLPWFEEQARQIQHHRLPLWDTHSWEGQSLIGQAQPGTAYPLNWLLWLVPRKHGHIRTEALQGYFIVIHCMAAFFMFLLCRDLGRSALASILAGIVFSLSGYLGTVFWPQMLNGAVWLPLIFMFQIRAASGVRAVSSSALCGVCLGLSWLSGHHQVPLFACLACMGVWAFFCFRASPPDWKMARLAAISMLFTFLVGALQILPAMEYGRLSLRWVGAAEPVTWGQRVPYLVHAKFSLQPIRLFGIVIPGFSEPDLYTGVVALALAALGVRLYWKEKSVRLFLALGVAGLAYSMGQFSVFQGIIYALLPWMEKARAPDMAIVVYGFAISALVAFGTDGLLSTESSASTKRQTANLVAGFSILFGIVLLGVLIANKLNWDLDARVMVPVLAGLALWGVFAATSNGSLRRVTGAVALILIALFELGNDAPLRLGDRAQADKQVFLQQTRSNPDIADFLRGQPGWYRATSNLEEIGRNWPDYHDVDFAKAYEGVTVNSYHLESHTLATQILLGIKYTLDRKPEIPGMREVFRGASDIGVFENREVFPRAWSVHALTAIDHFEQGQAMISEHYADLRSKAFMLWPLAQGPLAACPAAADQVAITRYEPEAVNIRASLACDGMVVLSDSAYPGWRAEVDGKSVDIHEVDLALRGVFVSGGKHEIKFRYRPVSVYLGLFLTMAGVVGAVVLRFFHRQRSRTQE